MQQKAEEALKIPRIRLPACLNAFLGFSLWSKSARTDEYNAHLHTHTTYFFFHSFFFLR